MRDPRVLYVPPEGDDGDVPAPLDSVSDITVDSVETATAAADEAETGDVDCVVTAADLPDGTGVDLVRRVRETAPDTGCVLYAAGDPDDPADVPQLDYVDRRGPDAAERLAEVVAVTARRRTHTAYPLPDAESDRLAALERLPLDAPSLARAFDRVTSLAAAHFGVDRAAVNVVDERSQQILSGRGLDEGTLPREETICTYTILDDDVTVVEDAATDPRFDRFEQLDEMDIRLYAGAPVTLEGDLPVGTLCIYDDAPGSLSEADRAFLGLLADEAAHWLDVHARLDAEQGDAADRAAEGRG